MDSCMNCQEGKEQCDVKRGGRYILGTRKVLLVKLVQRLRFGSWIEAVQRSQ